MAIFDPSVDLPNGIRALFERSTVSLTIADCWQEDCPLVGANSAFFELCGHEPEAVLGQNCRFLQPEGGAGPVTKRMRQFVDDPDIRTAKFLVPNVTKEGEPFLNLVYLTKLVRQEELRFILGSQFSVGARQEHDAKLYEQARNADLRQLKLLTSEHNWVVLGSFDALASSNSIIAQSRYE